MKVTRQNVPKAKPKLQYPVLMKFIGDKPTHFIVMFTGANSGFVVDQGNSDYQLGHSDTVWSSAEISTIWTKFTGKLVLENDK